jgi:hypothetical protein
MDIHLKASARMPLERYKTVDKMANWKRNKK